MGPGTPQALPGPLKELQERWLGQFLVTKANFNTVEVKVTPRMVRTATVSQQDCQRWPDEACEREVYETIDETDQVIEEEDAPETMKDVEAEDLGYYEVDRIHEHRYRRGWQFRTTWKGYADETWEPIRNFVLEGNADWVPSAPLSWTTVTRTICNSASNLDCSWLSSRDSDSVHY